MDRSRIEQIIFDALKAANQSRDSSEQIVISSDALLYGTGGQLDSMSLVALLIDIEEALQDEGFRIALGDEQAMSQSGSPFRDVPSLVAHIQLLVGQNP